MWIVSSVKIKGKWSGMTKKLVFSVYQVQLCGWSCCKDVSLGVTSKQQKIYSLNFFFISVTMYCYTCMSFLLSPMPGWYFCKYFRISFVSKLKNQLEVHLFTLWGSYIWLIFFYKLLSDPSAHKRRNTVFQTSAFHYGLGSSKNCIRWSCHRCCLT